MSNDFFSLNYADQLKLAVNTPDVDILRLCRDNPNIEKLCNDPQLWALKAVNNGYFQNVEEYYAKERDYLDEYNTVDGALEIKSNMYLFIIGNIISNEAAEQGDLDKLDAIFKNIIEFASGEKNPTLDQIAFNVINIGAEEGQLEVIKYAENYIEDIYEFDLLDTLLLTAVNMNRLDIITYLQEKYDVEPRNIIRRAADHGYFDIVKHYTEKYRSDLDENDVVYAIDIAREKNKAALKYLTDFYNKYFYNIYDERGMPLEKRRRSQDDDNEDRRVKVSRR